MVQAVALYSDHLNRFIFEDVSMGFWVSPFSLNRTQSYNFKPVQSCSKDAFVVHGKNQKTVESYTNNLLHLKKLCT